MRFDVVRDELAASRLGQDPRRLQLAAARLFNDQRIRDLSALTVPHRDRYGEATVTPAALGLLLVATLIERRPSEEWASAAQLHWHARAWSRETNDDPTLPRPVCALTGRQELGRSITDILRHVEAARCIVRLEVSRTAPIWTMWSRRQGEAPRRTLFVACHARELSEGLEALPHSAFNALPGGVVVECARLLAK
jgi:hypothetical protein